ncbi:MAG: hypothetical protein ABI162_08250 [Luteolibacter sp.]
MTKTLLSRLRILGISTFAISGWAVAWMAHVHKPEMPAVPEKEKSARTREARADDRHRESGDAAKLVTDAPFARLLASISEISSAARPGEPNQKLLDACRKALTNADAERRRRDFYLLMELMRPEDAAAMHQQFLELHREGRGFAPEYATFAHRWGEIDGSGALDYMMAEKPFRLPPPDFQYLIRGWGTTDPQAALGWLKQHPDMNTNMDGRFALMEGWIRDDPASATRWMTSENMSPNELVRCVSGGTLQQLYGPGLTEAAKWLSELPDDGGPMSTAARVGWRSIQIQLGQLSYDQASTAWCQVAGASWMTLDDFNRFGQNLSHATENTEGFPGYLNAIAAKWPADQVSQKFEQWAAANPESTIAWLTNSPDSALLKPALEGALRALEKSNPDEAAQLRSRLKE